MPGPLPASRLALVLAGALAGPLLGALAAPGPARAADLDAAPLRGTYAESTAATTWEGFYFGAHYGHGQADYDPKGASSGLVSQSVQQTTFGNEARPQDLVVLKRSQSNDRAFGGFVGYNWQVDDVVVGVEADYSRSNIKVGSSGSVGRTFSTSDQYNYDYTVYANATAKTRDLGSLRLRAGYAMGSFLPYLTIGLAGTRASIERSGGVFGTVTDVTPQTAVTSTNPLTGATTFLGYTPLKRIPDNTRFATETVSERNRAKFAVGVAIGAGIEWAITPNVLVRAEGIYSSFGSVGGGKLDVTQGRVGAGVKF